MGFENTALQKSLHTHLTISIWDESGGFFRELNSSARAAPTSSPRAAIRDEEAEEEGVLSLALFDALFRQYRTASATRYSAVEAVSVSACDGDCESSALLLISRKFKNRNIASSRVRCLVMRARINTQFSVCPARGATRATQLGAARRNPGRVVGPIRVVGASSSWLEQPLKHVIESQQFDKEALAEIFRVTRQMEDIRPNTDEARQLQGRIMSTLFYEPSTRTRLSFESAMARLGGTVLSTESAGEFSSAAKGESLEDSIRTVEAYADVIVLRHFQAGSAKKAAAAASVPILNAGDGPGQHPTQALLDVYTIQREIGRLDNIKIGMVGDLANGRTVRSLAYVLSMYDNVQMYFVAPDVVRMKVDIKTFLTEQGVEWHEVDDLKAVASDVDVLYQTRIQKERFQDRPEDYEKAKGKFIIDPGTMALMRDDAVVLHPLPRVDEIDPACDDDPRAAYFRQAKNGLYVRMALLKLALGGS